MPRWCGEGGQQWLPIPDFVGLSGIPRLTCNAHAEAKRLLNAFNVFVDWHSEV
jgi:hypothetical protein